MNSSPQATKNRIDERLDVALCDDSFQVHLHEQRYEKALASVSENDDLLEIGTGLGVFSARVAPAVATYRGIEYDGDTCKAAKTRVTDPEWIQEGDAQSLRFAADSFDAVICLEVLEHLPDYRKALDEICRVLRQDGRLVASIPYARVGAPSKINPYHLYEPGEKEFHSELTKRFAKVQTYYHRYRETSFEKMARKLRVRRFVGLARQYSAMSRGAPEEMKKVLIDEKRSGYLLGLFVVATHPR